MENKNFFGYKAAIGAFLVIFCNLGACTTLGTFLNSLAVYSEHALGAVGQIALANTLCNIALSIVVIKALSKLGEKTTMLISIILCSVHMLFYTLVTPGANPQSLVFMYIAGGLASFSITFGTHAVCSSFIAKWFIEKRGQITGMVLSGAGIGAAVWVFLAGVLFNAFDITNNPEAYKYCYWIFSVLVLIIGLISVIFLIRDPEKMGQKPLGYENATTSTGAGEVPGVSYKDAVKSPAFILFCIALLFTTVGGTAYLSYAPTWWQLNGMDPGTAGIWNSVYLLAAGAFLLVVGSVAKKMGMKGFVAFVCIGYILTFIFMILLGRTDMAVIMMILIVIFGAFAYPVNASIPSLVGTEMFGPREFGAISATMMIFVYIGQAIMSPIMAALLAAFENGMEIAWIIFAITTAIGMILLVAALGISPMAKLAKAGK